MTQQTKRQNGNARRGGGFTVLELLLAIAIIGFLMTIVATPIISIRSKGRDQRRIEDLQTIRKALELYQHDHGDYPPSPRGYNFNSYYFSCVTSGTTAWSNLEAYLKPYLDRLPKDPINRNLAPWATGGYCYAYGNVGSPNYPAGQVAPTSEPTYDLTGQLESTSHTERCGAKNYKFYFSDIPWCTAFGGAYSNQIYEASLF